jgi:CheY-like chemotaxis protein
MSKPLALIVEDDVHLNQIYAKALEASFETEIISDGSLVLMRLDQILPTVMILDLNLPGFGGRQILTAIRANPRLQRINVILCTADERQADSLQELADIVLLKPVSPSQLREIAVRFQ